MIGMIIPAPANPPEFETVIMANEHNIPTINSQNWFLYV